MGKGKKNIKEKRKEFASPFKDYWGNRNYFIIGVSLLTLIIGYFLMSQGKWDSTTSLSISPIILLIGYVILIPISIFIKQSSSNKKETDVPS